MVQPSSQRGAETGTETEGQRPNLAIGDVFELLQDPVRRYTLYELHMSSEPVVTVESLADVAAAAAAGDLNKEEVTIALEHEHLPKLADAGLVEYDRPTSKLWYRPRPALTEWLEHAAYTELPRSHPLLSAFESRIH